jgi:hypothetical protein
LRKRAGSADASPGPVRGAGRADSNPGTSRVVAANANNGARRTNLDHRDGPSRANRHDRTSPG